MDARTVATGFALGRVVIGVALVARPAKAAEGWIGPEADLPATQVMTRALGVRDLALGAGALASLREGGDPIPWLVAGVACDAVDFGATLAAGDALPPTGRIGVSAIAAGAALTGLALLRALR